MNLENKVNKASLNELENKVNKASLNELENKVKFKAKFSRLNELGKQS